MQKPSARKQTPTPVNLTPMLNSTNIGAFTVTSGAVDVVGGTVFGYLCVAPETGNGVDLDGSTGAAGQISTANLSLAPGVYNLRFNLIGSQRGSTTSTTVTRPCSLKRRCHGRYRQHNDYEWDSNHRAAYLHQ